MDEKLKKQLDGMSLDQLKEVEAYVEQCESNMGEQEDAAGEKAEAAEGSAVYGKPSTVAHSAYRGRK